MASTDPEISTDSSMPEWMKVKANANTNFEAPFAPQSPPAYEDSFFYIRYPNPASLFNPKQKDASETQNFNTQNKEIKSSSITFKDYSKHTDPCKEVFSGYPPIKTTAAASITSKPKAAGIDDGFKGEGAACGSSVIKVAHQMIADQKVTQRGYTEAAIDMPSVPDEGSTGNKLDINLGQYNLNARRGSKSLPASPSGSPTSRRRNKNISGNRYFTGTYEVPQDVASSRSWIMAALLGQKRDASYYASTSTINEEDGEHRLTGNLSLAASVDHLGPKPEQKPTVSEAPTLQTIAQGSSATSKAHKFRAKPTELRELNFWSPTSM